MTMRPLRDRCIGFLFVFLLIVAAGGVAAGPSEDLVIAVSNDRAARVKELLAAGVDPNTADPNGEPVLLIAARGGYAATVDALLAGKANVNARSKFGDSALMMAALGGHLEIAKTLRKRGADLDGPGWTQLIYAASTGQDAVVTYLLAEGAKINAVSPNGTSALMMAVREGKGSTVTLLIAKGADVNVRNQHDATALAWAVRGNEQAMVAALKRAGAKD
jgi:ankyrin repeat protein